MHPGSWPPDGLQMARAPAVARTSPGGQDSSPSGKPRAQSQPQPKWVQLGGSPSCPRCRHASHSRRASEETPVTAKRGLRLAGPTDPRGHLSPEDSSPRGLPFPEDSRPQKTLAPRGLLPQRTPAPRGLLPQRTPAPRSTRNTGPEV